jgi:hypothetical protein
MTLEKAFPKGRFLPLGSNSICGMKILLNRRAIVLGELHGIRGGRQWQYRQQWNDASRSSNITGTEMAEQGEEIHLCDRANLQSW